MNVLLRMLYQKSAENHEILTLSGGRVALTLAIEIADTLDAAHAAVDSRMTADSTSISPVRNSVKRLVV
jgi:hypothetical protein